MKLKLIWIIALFLLALPLVSATHIRVSGFNESSNESSVTTTNETLTVSDILITYHSMMRGNTSNLSGLRYFEISIPKNTNSNKMYIGLGNKSVTTGGGLTSISLNSGFWGLVLRTAGQAGTGNKANGESEQGIAYCTSDPMSTGTTIMIAVNGTGGMWMGINNTWCNSGNPATNTNPAYPNVTNEIFPMFGASSTQTSNASFLFESQGINFAYTKPTGYLGWDEASATDTTPPAVNITNFNVTTKINNRLNISCQSFDTATIGNITFNMSGKNLHNFSFSLTGASANYSQNITTNITRGNIINATCWARDASNNEAQNSTLITVANTVPTHTIPKLNASIGLNRTNENLTGYNQSGSDADKDITVFNYKWYKNKVYNATRWINDSSSVLYLPFDDNSTLDYALSNDGTAVNGANGTPEGKIGGGYMFDGVNDKINITYGESINLTNVWTINAWVKTLTNSTEGGVTRRVVAKEAQFQLGFSNQVFCKAGNLGGGTALVNNIVLNTFYYVTCEYNSTNIKIYVNGILETDTEDILDSNSTNSILIGSRDSSGFFNGTIDEVAIFNRSLSESEIMQIYQGTRDGFAVLDSDQTARGENWTIEMTPYDDTEAGIPLNSSINITILRTPHNGSNIVNLTAKAFNKNITINITPSNNPDSSILTYFWFVNFTGTPIPNLVISGVDLFNYTTNESIDREYFIFVNVSDGEDNVSSALFKWTLDTTAPTKQNPSAIDTANNISFFSQLLTNITLNLTSNSDTQCADTNLFGAELNFSNSTGQTAYNNTIIDITGNEYNFTEKINITTFTDGNYTLRHTCSDDSTEEEIDDYIINESINEVDGKKELNIQFIDDLDNPTTIKLKKIEINAIEQNLSNYTTNEFGAYKQTDRYIFFFNATKVLDKTQSKVYTFKVNAGKRIYYRQNSEHKAHFVSGDNWLNFDLCDDNGEKTINATYNINPNPNDNKKYDVEVVTKETDLKFCSVGGLNFVRDTWRVALDSKLPDTFFFNISGIANNSFTKVNYFNITINGSDAYGDKAQLFVNGIINSTSNYNNDSINITNVPLPDGNYTLTMRLNDTAGNKVNFSYFYNTIIDTIIPQNISPLNRTVNGNSTNILDNTDVNLTVEIRDTWLDSGNFSENCTSTSRSWINHSVVIKGNQTYGNVLESTNFTNEQVCGWKYYFYDRAGNELDPIFTFKIGSSASSESSTSGGSSQDNGAGPADQLIQGQGIINATNLTQEQQEQINQQVQAALCNENLPFINKLFSKCKIAGNGVCDYGENLGMDSDCKLTNEAITKGETLKQMWLLRFLILLAIFLLATKNDKFSIAVIAIITLMAYNGAFTSANPSALHNTPISDEAKASAEESYCMDVNYVLHLGKCLNPSNPAVGWAVVFLLGFLIAIKISKRNKSKGRRSFSNQ